VKPAVFLDRDGTVLEEANYLDSFDRLVYLPYSVDAVRLLNRAGFAVVIVTNQSGIGRGMYKEQFVLDTHQKIEQRFADGGARIDGFYYCPHHPEAVVSKYKQTCDCRKPAPGMLRQAAADLDLDLSQSFMVGDRWSDIGVANAVGARGILVRTGYGKVAEAAPKPNVRPDLVTDNLMSAVSWILREAKSAR
jgi:D,D-heptose 1,7-bisphosphate phosphatase